MGFFDFTQPSYQFGKEIRNICKLNKISISDDYHLTTSDYYRIINTINNNFIKSPVHNSILNTSQLYDYANFYNKKLNAKTFAMICYTDSLAVDQIFPSNPSKDDEIFREIFGY